MKKKLCWLRLYLCLSIFPLFAEIKDVAHFDELISEITPETLILLDIDDTLLVPVQMLGCDEWFQFQLQKHQGTGLSVQDALEKTLAEWEAVRHITQME
ncbi:MAG: DUF2608 domain-containing protein, partial [Chlamydiota bacterium]